MEKLLFYDELSIEAKKNALKIFIKLELNTLNKLFSERKKLGIHQKINSKYTFSKIVNQIQRINKYKKDSNFCEKTIIGNLCYFNSDGHYYSFFNKRFICDF